MSFATDDAEWVSAREILAECRARVMVAIRQEEERPKKALDGLTPAAYAKQLH
ncbi:MULTISPECIES: hypothetical protein [Luteibacter]|uniref:hypothetical protein n=1 Tax=Luteibacter sp. dw_328 TaxID=2719796 RepID=UPI000AD0C4E4|nr:MULTISPECIES: hypothetical protein [Luteibacter]